MELKESLGRERKPSTFLGSYATGDAEVEKSLREYQKKPKKKAVKAETKKQHAAKEDVIQAKTIGRPKDRKQKNHSNPPQPSLQERVQEELEEKHIAKCQERKSKHSKVRKVLPEGAVDLADIETAIKQGAKECSVSLLDWNSSKVKMIGYLCKVYWDGEDTWYYARILNYDSFYDKHYIYYIEDNTAEWICFKDEIVLVAEEMVMARLNPGGAPWAAQRFWISEKANSVCHNFPGFHKGATYVEYLSDQKNKEYAFLQRKCLDPMKEKYIPSKQSAAFRRSLKSAEKEQQAIDAVIELLHKVMQDSVFSALYGEQWVGYRVRTATHRIVQRGESRSEVLECGSVYSIGTIRSYCPGSGEHFVVFDDVLLQPQWIICQKSTVDVLFGVDETAPIVGNTSNTDEIAPIVGNTSSTDEITPVVGNTCSNNTQCTWSPTHPMCGNGGYLDSIHVNDCLMCQRELAPGSYKRCERCGVKCHTYCAAEETSSGSKADGVGNQAWSASSAVPWTCWNCVVCYGCDASSWNKSLLAWNAQRVEPEGPDLDMHVCGDCLYRYKHIKDFCPSCFKPYATDDSMLPLLGPVVVIPDPITTTGPTDMAEETEDSGLIISNTGSTENVTEKSIGSTENNTENTTVSLVKDNIHSETATTSQSECMEIEGETSKEKNSSTQSNVLSAETAMPGTVDLSEENMVECNECSRWVHARCEGIDKEQYDAMTLGTHPIWGDEYLCPLCRVKISKSILKRMQSQDQYYMFAEPVTERVAKNYYDIIRNPMDMSTMTSKAARGLYKSLQALRQDFELMCLNAILFNTPGDEYWREARRFYDEVQRIFQNQKRKSHGSAFGAELKEAVLAYDHRVEEERLAKLKKRKVSYHTNTSITTAATDTTSSNTANDTNSNTTTVDQGPAKRSRTARNWDHNETVASSGTTAATTVLSNDTQIETDSTTSNYTDNKSNSSAQKQSSANTTTATTTNKSLTATVPTSTTPEEISLNEGILLPTRLARTPDPTSYLTCTVISQTMEDAYYLMCHDCCFVCGSSGRAELMLFCIDCGEAVHSFCAEAPLALMTLTARAEWRCMNCKVCKCCQISQETVELGKLLYCEGCDNAFHANCMVPKVPFLPEGSWFCADCVQCHGRISSKENDSHSNSHSIVHCWGLNRKECWECQTQREIQQAEAAIRAEEQRLLYASRVTLCHCNVCYQSCTIENAFICTGCGCSTHTVCSGNSNIGLLSNSNNTTAAATATTDASLCKHCMAVYLHLLKGKTTTETAVQKTAIALVRQSNQQHIHNRQQKLLKLENERRLVYNNDGKLLRAVVAWGTLRLQWYATFIPDTSFLSPIGCINALSKGFIAERAMRFYGLWTRKEGSNRPITPTSGSTTATVNVASNTTGIATTTTTNTTMPLNALDLRRINLLRGLDERGQQMTAERLLRTATLAAAFLEATNVDVRKHLTTEQELAPVLAVIAGTVPQTTTEGETTTSPTTVATMQTLQECIHVLNCPPIILTSAVLSKQSDKHHTNTATSSKPSITTTATATQSKVPSTTNSSMRTTTATTTTTRTPLFSKLPQPIEPSKPPSALHMAAMKPTGSTAKPTTSTTNNTTVANTSTPKTPTTTPTAVAATSSRRRNIESNEITTNQPPSLPPPQHQVSTKDYSTLDVLYGDGFYAEKNKLYDIAPHTTSTTTPAAAIEVSSLFNRQEIRCISATMKCAQTYAVKDIEERNYSETPEGKTLLNTRTEVYNILHQVIAQIETQTIAQIELPPEISKPPSLLVLKYKQVLDKIASALVNGQYNDEYTNIATCFDCTIQEKHDNTTIKSTIKASPAKILLGSNMITTWQDPRSCCLCHDSIEDSIVGRLIPNFDGSFIHINCLRWCPEIIESDGILKNAISARDKAMRTFCFYCNHKGATLHCTHRKKCKRSFHLRCAIASRCALLENHTSVVDTSKAHDIYTMVLCPEHIPTIENNSKLLTLWTPYDPLRTCLIEENQDRHLAAELLSQRSNRAIRAGALTILNIGKILPKNPAFYSVDYIYPHRYRAARIFWSMKTPWERTLYSFEIFLESDFDSLDSGKLDYIRNMLEQSDRATSSSYNNTNTTNTSSNSNSNSSNYYPGNDNAERPIFRVVAMDNPTQPLFSHSLRYLFDTITQQVRECNRESGVFGKRYNTTSATTTGTTTTSTTTTAIVGECYGYTPHTFFGLGTPFVRRAIELFPESLSLMISLDSTKNTTLYAPVYRLPSYKDIINLQEQLLRSSECSVLTSMNGCIRADAYGSNDKKFTGKRITRILTKVADTTTDSNTKNNTTNTTTKAELNKYEQKDDEEENKRVNEALRSRYLDMTSAYLHNPYAKLDVKKSGIHGWGLFAKINFEKNDIIVEYIGQKIRQVIADRREVQYEEEGVGSCYLFRLDKEDIIDATRRGGMARFMNHCCEPNAYARVITAPSLCTTTSSGGRVSVGLSGSDDKHIIIMAARDIQEGEEITYDYKFPIEDSKLTCYCGAPGCGGYMN